jgi:hypothetical protein
MAVEGLPSTAIAAFWAFEVESVRSANPSLNSVITITPQLDNGPLAELP